MSDYFTNGDMSFATLHVCLMSKICFFTLLETDSPETCKPHTWQSSLAYVLDLSWDRLWSSYCCASVNCRLHGTKQEYKAVVGRLLIQPGCALIVGWGCLIQVGKDCGILTLKNFWLFLEPMKSAGWFLTLDILEVLGIGWFVWMIGDLIRSLINLAFTVDIIGDPA